MKVGILIDAWFPIVGGGQIHVWEIADRMVKSKDVQIEIITRKLKNETGKIFGEEENYHYGRLRIKRLGIATKWANLIGEISYLFSSFLFLLKEDFDIIHAQPFLPALPAKLSSLIKRKPIVLTVHGTRLFENKNIKTPSRILEKYILTKINYDLQISVTRAFLKIRNNNKKITVIPNGIELGDFRKLKNSKSILPQNSLGWKV